MTKQEAIRKLYIMGVWDIRPEGKFLIHAKVPKSLCGNDRDGLFDPRDLLAELEERQASNAGKVCTECGIKYPGHCNICSIPGTYKEASNG